MTHIRQHWQVETQSPGRETLENHLSGSKTICNIQIVVIPLVPHPGHGYPKAVSGNWTFSVLTDEAFVK